MKKRNPAKSLEEISPYLIQAWRQIVKSPGPPDYLLTREFRLCTSCVKEGQAFLKAPTIWTPLWLRSPMLGAYMTYFWPIHYQQALAIFKLQGRPLGNVLDLGSGPGPFAVAALEARAKEVYALDSSERCLQVLAELAANLGHTLAGRVWNCPKTTSVEETFDTITLGHSFLEMTHFDKDQGTHLIRHLVRKLNPGGRIIIVEYSDSKRNKLLQEIYLQLAQLAPLPTITPTGEVQSMLVQFEYTKLMEDIMRSLKKQERQSNLRVLTLEKLAVAEIAPLS